jgi:hypothetical protein
MSVANTKYHWLAKPEKGRSYLLGRCVSAWRPSHFHSITRHHRQKIDGTDAGLLLRSTDSGQRWTLALRLAAAIRCLAVVAAEEGDDSMKQFADAASEPPTLTPEGAERRLLSYGGSLLAVEFRSQHSSLVGDQRQARGHLGGIEKAEDARLGNSLGTVTHT